jgi:hypothetical protein
MTKPVTWAQLVEAAQKEKKSLACRASGPRR